MKKIFAFFKAHIFLTAFVVSALVCAGCLIYQFAVGPSLNEVIQINQASSQNDVRQADSLEKQQVNSEVERRTEDGVREQVITPKLDAARRNSAHSAQSLKTAKSKYENEKTNTSNLSVSQSDNCRELADLFANVIFEDCLK